MSFVSPIRRTGFLGDTLKITSPFGTRTHPISGKVSFHNGLDIGIPQGTPLFAAAPGIVKSTDPECRSSTNGGYVTIKHADGAKTSYVHMSRIDVRPGQQVERWTQIGLSGGRKGDKCSGSSTGPHLHFVLRTDGKNSVDPTDRVNWYPFRLSRKGRLLPVQSRKWGGLVSSLRQLPWWGIALGSAAGVALLVLIVKRPRARSLPG
jgi:murein DD-endopeptidase MepM/ murein hydrolase activator NlpD